MICNPHTIVKDGNKLTNQLFAFYDAGHSVLIKQSSCIGLKCPDYEDDIKPLVHKLRPFLQNEWGEYTEDFEQSFPGVDPPFSHFLGFLRKQATYVMDLPESEVHLRVNPKRNTARNIAVIMSNTYKGPVPTNFKHFAQ